MACGLSVSQFSPAKSMDTALLARLPARPDGAGCEMPPAFCSAALTGAGLALESAKLAKNEAILRSRPADNETMVQMPTQVLAGTPVLSLGVTPAGIRKVSSAM